MTKLALFSTNIQTFETVSAVTFSATTVVTSRQVQTVSIFVTTMALGTLINVQTSESPLPVAFFGVSAEQLLKVSIIETLALITVANIATLSIYAH